jgi:hypothetical protein
MITTATAIATAQKTQVLKLRNRSNAPTSFDKLSPEGLKELENTIGRAMNSRSTEYIPKKQELVLRLTEFGNQIKKNQSQHDRESSNEDVSLYDRALSASCDLDPSNEDALPYDRASSVGDTIATRDCCASSVGDPITTSDCIDEITRFRRVQDRIVDIKAGFSSWRLMNPQLSGRNGDDYGFCGVFELMRNLRPDYPIIHYGGQFMTEDEIKGIQLPRVLNAAVAPASIRPENNWYSPAFLKEAQNTAACGLDNQYSDSVPEELAILNNILAGDRNPEAIGIFLESYLGELVGDAIPDRASFTREEFKVKVAEEIAERNALLSSLLTKVIMPLLRRFQSRSRGCIFPIGIFYDYLLKIKYAKEAMMHGSTYGNSNIFTESEKVQHEDFRDIMIESAIAYAEEASDEYESGWSVYEADMMLQGFMAAPDGLTHAQKFNLYEYRESLLDELHVVLEDIQKKIDKVLPKNKGRSA